MPKNPSPEPASILDTVNMLDTMATDSSDSDSEVEPPLSIRLYSSKPRNLVQRRATITGASPTSKHGIDIEQFWKELKQEHSTTFQLRDKAASCAHGLDNVLPVVNIRPQTCLGLESTKKRKKTDEQTDDKKVQFEEKLTDVESIHPDDAKRTTHNVRERVTPTQSYDDGTNATNKNSNNKKQVMDNVNDSNNISDIIVPLDECNNFIGDTCNINKNTPDNTETGARYVKERGKLDKSYSTPAYDLSDTEDKEDRKLAFLQNPFCKLDLPVHCSNNVPSGASTKTDVCTYTDSAIDHEKLKNTNGEHKETSVSRICGGNVARKISDIEKQIAHENAEEQASVFGVPKELDSHKNIIRITINDASPNNNCIEKNQSNIDCIAEGNVNTCDEKHSVTELSTECKKDVINKFHSGAICSVNLADKCRENIVCNNSEMSNSEEAYSSSSSSSSSSNSNSNSNSSSSNSSIERDETLQKFDRILQTVDCALTQHAKLLEKKSSVMISNEDSTKTRISPSNNVKSSIEDDLPNISKMQISGKPQAKEIKSAESPLAQAMVQSCRYIELPKIESVRKLENKSHVRPPEPPPRKYYTKHAAVAANDLKLNITSKIPNSLEKPQVPERPKIRRDFRKVDNLNLPVNHTRSNSDCQDRENSSSDVNTENSIDFIERQITSLNDQKFTQSDTSLYNENANKQLREDKYSFEKYEPFIEKFACSSQSITDCYKSGHSPRNVECLDGATHSKQMILDLKAKSSEKDKSFEKSVVNRAMMVARSIGLHSSLSKSNSSPRSNRKRNMLLASKYY